VKLFWTVLLLCCCCSEPPSPASPVVVTPSPCTEDEDERISQAIADMGREECQDCREALELHEGACKTFCKLRHDTYVRARSGGCLCRTPSGHVFSYSWDYSNCDRLGPHCSPQAGQIWFDHDPPSGRVLP